MLRVLSGRRFIMILIMAAAIRLAYGRLDIEVESHWTVQDLNGSFSLPIALQIDSGKSGSELVMEVVAGGDEETGIGCLIVRWPDQEWYEKINPFTMKVKIAEGKCDTNGTWVKSASWPSASKWLISPAVFVSVEKDELIVSQLFRQFQSLRHRFPRSPSNITLIKANTLQKISIYMKREEEGHCFPLSNPRFLVLQESDSVLLRSKERQEMENKEKVSINENQDDRKDDETTKNNGKKENLVTDVKEERKQKSRPTKITLDVNMLEDYGFCKGSDYSPWTLIELDSNELVEMKVEYIQGTNASFYINQSLFLSLDAHNSKYYFDSMNRMREGKQGQGLFLNNTFCFDPWFEMKVYGSPEYEVFFNCDPRMEVREEGNKEGKENDEECPMESSGPNPVREGETVENYPQDEEENSLFYKFLMVLHTVAFVTIVDVARLVFMLEKEARKTRDHLKQRGKESTADKAKRIFLLVITALEVVVACVALGIAIALVND